MNTPTHLVVRWTLPVGFYVRRLTRNGLVLGFLTDRGGWGKPEIASHFTTYPQAVRACSRKFKVGFVDVAENVGSTHS